MPCGIAETKQHVSVLLFLCETTQVQILAEDLAKPLREKMGSPQYTDVLLAACFQDTVEATKVRHIKSNSSRSRD